MNRWRRRRLYRTAAREWQAGIVDGTTAPSIRIERPGTLPGPETVAYHEARRRAKGGEVDRVLPLDVWALVLAEALRR